MERGGALELAAYGAAAERVAGSFPAATVTAVEPGWENRWREFHHAVRIGPLWVGPPWEEAPPDALPIVIDPGGAFGTGAHPTTRLCLELLLTQPRSSLVDVGCGSGVIAIAAARLGFGPVLAVDVDPLAVATAAANAAVNAVEIEVRHADALAETLPPAGLAVANISLASIDALAGRLEGRRAITSGYLTGDRPALPGLRHHERRMLDGWAADCFEPGGTTARPTGQRTPPAT